MINLHESYMAKLRFELATPESAIRSTTNSAMSLAVILYRQDNVSLPTSPVAVVMYLQFVCLFVLRFYGPGNPMGSCRARSVYSTC